MTIISLLIIITTLGFLAYHSASAKLWLIIPPAMLVGLQFSGQVHSPWNLMLWLFYAVPAIFYLLPDLRKKWITAPLLHQFRKVMPPISRTEQEALEAGNVWMDGELFSGKPDWQHLLDLPAPKLNEEEQAFIYGPVEELCRRLDDWEICEQRDLPQEIWEFIKTSGLFGLIIPKKYGGKGFSALAHSTIVMKIASRSVTAAVTVMVPNSLGPAKLLLHYGTDEQKQQYLQRLATGKEIPCFALTGPHAGSDAGAIPDLGVVEYGEFDGKRVLGIRLNFEKRYITLAPVATLIGLAFKLKDPSNLISEDANPGVTVALIPRNTTGIEIGRRHMPLNIAFQNGPIVGKDVFIPLDWVVGGKAGIGQGWRMLVECLTEGRGISLPALSTGAGKAASRYTGAYAAIRRQFGMPIGKFEGIEEALGAIGGATYQMDAARLLTLSALDSGETPSVITAIVKYHLTERYRQVINHAMDIQAGSGICLGPNNLMGRTYQAAPVAITVEGANILTRNMIIFGQGAIRAHPYILQEFNAAREEDDRKAIELFDNALMSHAGHLTTNLSRTLWLGVTRGLFARKPVSGSTGRYFQHLDRFSAAFALTSDLALMTLGGSLKRRERLSARLGDILSELYIASAVLKHFIDQGQKRDDLPLLQHAMDDSFRRIATAFKQLFRNFPYQPLGLVLRMIVFPNGANFLAPTDQADRAVSRILLQPGKSRERLTRGIFITNDLNQQVGRVETAFQAVTDANPIESMLKSARSQGLIFGVNRKELIADALSKDLLDRKQLAILEKADRLRTAVIQVDAFPTFTTADPANTIPFDRGHRGAA